MPRPSLKDHRSEQILDAYLSCVARFGLDGATQERIAKLAGVKRPLLRHYLGNRDEMVSALGEHVVRSFAASGDMLGAVLAEVESASELVELLYAEDVETDPRLMLAWQALTVAVDEHPEMRQPLLDSLQRFLDIIEAVLRRLAPEAPEALVRAVTMGIAAPYANFDAMAPLNPPETWRDDLKAAAQILAKSLEQHP